MWTGHPFCKLVKGKICLRSCGRAKRTTDTKLLSEACIIWNCSLYTKSIHRKQESRHFALVAIYTINTMQYIQKHTISYWRNFFFKPDNPTSQNVERNTGTALIKHRNVSGVTRIDQKSSIHKITCNSDSGLRLGNVQIWKTSVPSILLSTLSCIFMSWKGEGQWECLYDMRFAKAVELIWDVGSSVASATFQKSFKDHTRAYTVWDPGTIA